MNYNYKGFVKKVFSFITRCLDKNLPLQKISVLLRAMINSYSGLNRNQKYKLYVNTYQVIRGAKSSLDWKKKLCLRTSYDSILKAARRVQRDTDLQAKRDSIRAMLKTDTYIFYVCSKHSNPAPDHADYQGRVYVDRYWREKVTAAQYYPVLSYIKNRGIMTVQEIMGEPVYLTTRPYCKHYFIPVATSTVLHQSEKKTVEQFGIHKTKKYTSSSFSNSYMPTLSQFGCSI